MPRSVQIAVVSVTAVLVLYALLVLLQRGAALVGFLFFASPFLVIWMVYSVIRKDVYRGRALEEDEEWGYADQS